ncbi:MAG TPA: PHP domain-containing protein, partial [Bacteroidia bacterium]|nr:PHP domain-containing protein [Bacteroidia bacterium]
IGPKKVKVIWEELGIETLGELLYACNENRLVDLKGFGAKTQEQIKGAVTFMLNNAGLKRYSDAWVIAQREEAFIRNLKQSVAISQTGSIRRKCEIQSEIDFLVATDSSDALFHAFTETGQNGTRQPWGFSYLTDEHFPVRLFTCSKMDFGTRLFVTTGSEVFLSECEKYKSLAATLQHNYADEDSLFAAAGLAFIPPECREGSGELSIAESGSFLALLEYADLKGCLHNHSTYSDGINSLREMAVACINEGLEYFGICDHSKSAFYANGLSVERVIQQHLEIDKLNAELAPFKIFKGIESDILPDGSLDYPDAVLDTFDFVVASVHSNLRMDKTRATERLLKAISNPYTTVLGHPTGRLLLAREGYPLDMDEILEACRQHDVVIELNANPYRLDLDWRWIQTAVSKGIKIAVNPDAHRVEGIKDMQYGVWAARKGMLLAADTFNARSLSQVSEYFAARKQRVFN